MYTNAFIGKTEPPTDAEVAATLGPAKPVWDRLIADLAAEHNLTEREWKSSSPKWGWALRIVRKKRNILYLIACEGCFRITLVLGDKAVKAAYGSGLPAPAIKLIKESKKYPEGTAIYIDVKGAKDLPFIKKLAGIKLEN
jgi:hypothetical protein